MWRKAALTWGCKLAQLVPAAEWRRFLKALKTTYPVIQQPHGKPVSQKRNYTPNVYCNSIHKSKHIGEGLVRSTDKGNRYNAQGNTMEKETPG